MYMLAITKCISNKVEIITMLNFITASRMGSNPSYCDNSESWATPEILPTCTEPIEETRNILSTYLMHFITLRRRTITIGIMFSNDDLKA